MLLLLPCFLFQFGRRMVFLAPCAIPYEPAEGSVVCRLLLLFRFAERDGGLGGFR